MLSLRAIILERQKIPEFLEQSGVFFVVIGAPAVGKTTMIDKFTAINPNFKVFDTDITNLLYTKDPTGSHHYAGASNKTFLALSQFLENQTSGKNNVMYTTTLGKPERIANVLDVAKRFGYRTYILHILSTLEYSLRANAKRTRSVDVPYIKQIYFKQQRLMKYLYNNSNVDKYYVILNLEGKYIYYTFENDILRKIK